MLTVCIWLNLKGLFIDRVIFNHKRFEGFASRLGFDVPHMRPERIHPNVLVRTQCSKETIFIVEQLSVIESSVLARILERRHNLIIRGCWLRFSSRFVRRVVKFGTGSIPGPEVRSPGNDRKKNLKKLVKPLIHDAAR